MYTIKNNFIILIILESYGKMNMSFRTKVNSSKTMKMKCLFNNFFFAALAITLLFLGSACSKMPEGNPQDGERWFRMNRCNGCHGEKGTGGKGPMIAGLKLSYRKFLHQLRKPDSAIMPPFETNQLSDKDAADIYIWLQTLK